MARGDRSGGIDGIIVLSKPAGPTSHDLVAIVRRLTGTRRVGHGGTLDPFASGVLPIFLGLGTRMVEYHMGDSKSYRATVCFGARSATDDRDGELMPTAATPPTRAQVLAALPAFRGAIEQRPPAFSALRVGGRHAYELAREGTPPELAPRPVTIGRLELLEWDDSDAERPTATVAVDCSAGTYIRALARDLGELLGCGAYLGALVRTASGPFRLEQAHPLDEFRAAAADPARLRRIILPIDAGLDAIPAVPLPESDVDAFARGQQIRLARRPKAEQGSVLRLLGPEGNLVGMGRLVGARVAPDKVFVPLPAAPAKAHDHDGESPSPAASTDPSATTEPAVARRSGAAPTDERAAAEETADIRGTEGRPFRERRLDILLPDTCIETVQGITDLRPDLGRLYIAVGVFDGLHRGHLYLLRHLRRAARRAGARPAVITFDAHPEEVIRGVAPPLLCDPAERIVRLAATGVQVCVIQHFDEALRETEYDAFVATIQERVEVAGFLMTPDAAFGHGRRGTPETLASLGAEKGFEVTVVQPLLVDGRQVRSSEIRSAVEAGRLGEARHLLGRRLSVTGHVLPTADRDRVAVGFDLPAALPPEGSYGALAGPAWLPRRAPDPASESVTALVVSGSPRRLELTPQPQTDDVVRVVFGDRS